VLVPAYSSLEIGLRGADGAAHLVPASARTWAAA